MSLTRERSNRWDQMQRILREGPHGDKRPVASFEELEDFDLIYRVGLKTNFDAWARTESSMQAKDIAACLVEGTVDTMDVDLKTFKGATPLIEPRFTMPFKGEMKVFNPDALLVRKYHGAVEWLVIEAKHALQARDMAVFADKLGALQEHKNLPSVVRAYSTAPDRILGALCSMAPFPNKRLPGIKCLLKCGARFKQV